jgi:hypothetical protein
VGAAGRPSTKASTIPKENRSVAEVSYVPLEGRMHGRLKRELYNHGGVIVLGGTCTADQDKADNQWTR